MKNLFLLMTNICCCLFSVAQNVFPSSGNVGIATTTPSNILQIALKKNEGIDIGIPGDPMDWYTLTGQDIGSYSIRFYGYRDVTPNQIGAKISAIRVNNFQDNAAAVQGTDLAFFTSDGWGSIGTGLVDLGLERMRITYNGNVLIGRTSQANSSYKLDVNGNIRANKIVVNTTGADYVFDSVFNLLPVDSLRQFIAQYHHLPDIPPASKLRASGLDVGEMQKLQLQKIEELTLYLI